MKTKRYDCIFNLLLIIISLIAINFCSDIFVFVVAIIMCVSSIAFNIRDINGKAVYIAFFSLIFLFLLSRDFISLILYGELALPFSQETNKRVLLCVLFSMFFLTLGSYCSENYKVRFGKRYTISLDHSYDNSYHSDLINEKRKIVSKTIMYISFMASFAVVVEQVMYVSALSYYDLYLTYSSKLPGIVVKFGDMYSIAFFAFLACLPTKKECKLPIALYALLGFISLGTGQRNQMIIHLIVIIIYLLYRQFLSNGTEIWLPRKYMIAIVLCIPFIISFLYFWGNYRIGNSTQEVKYSEILVNFLNGQGKSIDIIGYAMTYNMPSGKLYSFGDIIDFFINSYFSKFVLGVKTYKQYTPEYALNMHSFGQYITYVVAPTKYLAGGGIGSSYIAEAYVDFGYWGIGVWSFVYGIILTQFSKINKHSWIKMSFLLFAISKILMAPRTSASGFIAATFNFINIFTILLIYIISKSNILKVTDSNHIANE